MDSRILTEHPVSDAMRDPIVQCLRDIERDHQVRVLFACESGSRGWGFASPDSDDDLRFVYVNRLDSYLTVEPGRDVIEQPVSGELDLNGGDLRKALKLLHSSNPVLLEWLRSPSVCMQDEVLAPELRSLPTRCLPSGGTTWCLQSPLPRPRITAACQLPTNCAFQPLACGPSLGRTTPWSMGWPPAGAAARHERSSTPGCTTPTPSMPQPRWPAATSR